MAAQAFDLAEEIQAPVIVMLDLDLGMNDHLSEPLNWDENRAYKRGKVLSASDLDEMASFGRYLDSDGDGIPYRTIPATHPTKGSFFTRGSSRDENARYTEDSGAYVRNMNRLAKKWDTCKTLVPAPVVYQKENTSHYGLIFFGTTLFSALEVIDLLRGDGMPIDAMCVKAFPFPEEVLAFIESHDKVFVVEQNRDAQFRSLLVNELEVHPKKLIKVLNFDGMPITADAILNIVVPEIGLVKQN